MIQKEPQEPSLAVPKKNHENRPERFPGKREPACDNIEMRNSRPEKERLFLRKKAAGCVRPADRTGKGGFVLPDHQGGFVLVRIRLF